MSEVRDRNLKEEDFIRNKNWQKQKALSILAWSISWSNSNTKAVVSINVFTEARKGNAKNIEQYYRYSLNYDCTYLLENIQHPILLVYGREDSPFYKYAKLLQKKLPHNELKFIDHVEHQIPTKAANQVK